MQRRRYIALRQVIRDVASTTRCSGTLDRRHYGSPALAMCATSPDQGTPSGLRLGLAALLRHPTCDDARTMPK